MSIKTYPNNDIAGFLSENSFAKSTQDTYRHFLSQFFSWVEADDLTSIEELTSYQIKDWIDSHEWGNSTQSLAAVVIRAYFGWKFGPEHGVLKLRIKRNEPEPQRTWSISDVRKLFASINLGRSKGIRDRALIALMLDTGLRASEVTGLKLKHLDLEQNTVKAKIKGGSWGTGVFGKKTNLYLQEWLSVRSKLAVPDAKTVFVSIGGLKPGTSLTRDGLRTIFRKLGEKAGLGLISPHDMRRSFVTISLQNGAPTRIIQKAGRWKNIREVERYSLAIMPSDFEPYFPTSFLES